MFVTEMKKTLNDEFNYSVTENGGLGYRTTGKELLDLNFAVSSLRNSSEQEIIDRFTKSFYENKELAVKWLFFARDIREGLGERRLFRILIKYLAENHENIVLNLMEFIPEYGRWDDMWVLLDVESDKILDKAYRLIERQLMNDIANLKHSEPISLLAKWLPSENTSSSNTKKMAKNIRKKLDMTSKEYRQTLSALRKYLDITEVKMCDNKWGDIDYSKVPSKANLLYKNAFTKHDETRRNEYFEKLQNGETKINSSVAFPHDIVHKYTDNSIWGTNVSKLADITLEEMWKALPNLVKGDSKTLVVADGSGSMTCRIDGNSGVMALEVANALAIYFAEKASGEFKNKYITFSSSPQLVDFSNCETLRDKLELAYKHDECSNTNIEATFDLILQTAINGKMKQEDIPNNILNLSDMEFDYMTCGNVNDRMFDAMAKKYESYGYKLPRLVFWNLNSRTGTIPVIENDLGVALVSGFSTNIVKMVLSGTTDPYECLVEQLMSDRYKDIVINN